MVAIVPLTERDQQVLDFERQQWVRAGVKEQAIRDLFGMSATRYYQLLRGLIKGSPAAEVYDPQLVRRLRRVVAAGRAGKRVAR